jgi:hypothetical protein
LHLCISSTRLLALFAVSVRASLCVLQDHRSNPLLECPYRHQSTKSCRGSNRSNVCSILASSAQDDAICLALLKASSTDCIIHTVPLVSLLMFLAACRNSRISAGDHQMLFVSSKDNSKRAVMYSTISSRENRTFFLFDLI